MNDKGFLEKRKQRCIASILAYKDENCNTYLPDDISNELRKKILDEINAFYGVVFDYVNENINQGYIDFFVEQFEDLREVIDRK